MTLDFGISPVTPQRKRRDYTKKAQRPATGGIPAPPPTEPRQAGGQLLDMRQYEKGNWGEAINAIEDFVGKQGGLSTLSKWQFEDHVEKQRKAAEDLRKQRTQAYADMAAISDETKKLQRKNKFEEAQQNRTANPWLRFFYYDGLSRDAANEASLDYNSWAGRNLSKLAKENDDSVISLKLTEKATELADKYNYLPKAFLENVVKAKLGSQQYEIKKKIIEKRFDNSDDLANKTARTTTIKGIKNAVKLIKSSKGALTAEGMKALETAVQESRASLIAYYGDEKTANKIVGSFFQKLWIDVDNPGNKLAGKNDLGEYLTGEHLKLALHGIKTKDGIPFGDLVVGEKGETINNYIDSSFKSAYSLIDMAEKATLHQLKTAGKNWTRDQDQAMYNKISAKEKELGRTLSPQERQELAEEQVREAMEAGLDQSGKSGAEAVDYIWQLYATPKKVPTEQQQLDFSRRVAEKSRRGEFLDDEFISELRSYGLESLVVRNQEKVVKWRDERTQSLRSTLLTDLQNENKQRILSHSSLATYSQEGPSGKAKYKNAELAVEESNTRLRDETEELINEKIDRALSTNPQALTDSKVRREIYTDINDALKTRPQYSDPNFYYNLNQTDGTALGTQYNNVPVFSKSKKTSNGWEIEILSLDNGTTWSSSALPALKNNEANTRAFLAEQFIFDDSQMKEVIRAVHNNDLSQISKDTREVMQNFEYATGGVVPMNEVVLQQIMKFTENKTLEDRWKRNAVNLKGAFLYYDAAPPDFTPVDVALTHNAEAGDYKSSLTEDNKQFNRVRFKLSRPTGQLGQNPVPAPVSGSVIDSGTHPQFGNYIIIRANVNGPGYRKGDRIMMSGGSVIKKPTGHVNIGTPVMLTGGVGTVTGGLNPGQIQMTIYGAGDGFPDRLDQKVQSHQVDFLEENFYPLIRRIR